MDSAFGTTFLRTSGTNDDNKKTLWRIWMCRRSEILSTIVA